MAFRPISRRTVLRGLGVSMALPWLEAMGTSVSWAEATDIRKACPNRLAFIYVPNGVHIWDWTPAEEGELTELTPVLKPLDPVKEKLLVLSGLTADKARANGDGGGDHARALAAFMTGVQPRKTSGADFRAGISADQVAAQKIGHLTRLPSLELGVDPSGVAGNCDTGYNCVYSSTMAWRSENQPMPKEIDPQIVFERLFGTTSGGQSVNRDRKRKSVLDFVREDSGSLSNKLGRNDQAKLDEYFTSIREIETRIDRADKFPPLARPAYEMPAGIPRQFEEHLRLMCDMIVLAFQADITRVTTMLFANEGSNRSYPFVGVPEAHHYLSHHQKDPNKLAKIRDINIFHVKQLSYLLQKLDSIQEGDGTLLDHSMIVYGSGNSDGDRHNHDDLPIVVAGGGGGTLKTGRHIRYPKETPLNNLWLSLLDRMELQVDSLGDSTGTLQNLA
ncbi:DUF1552 domain-containing protein [Planctomicrobium sp. SH664]|uniref:DUF1552 domain-containing protein n=1 Tax=Planctomicrobium sp. SH664 TaxID=3448125 RepID=UPI003F5C25CC